MKKLNFLKIVVAVIFTAIATICPAQDNYRAALLKFSEAGNSTISSVKKTLVPTLQSVAISSFGYSEDKAKGIAEKYCTEKLEKVVLDLMEESFKNVVTESDLNAANQFIATGKGATAMKHSQAYNSQEGQAKMMKNLVPCIMALYQGQTPEKIKSDAPADYVKKFNEFCKLTKLNNIINSSLGQITKELGNDKKVADMLSKFLDDNLLTMVMDMGYPTVTSEDLDTLISFYSTESGKRITEGTVKLSSKTMELGQKIVFDFIDYAKNK